MGWTSTSELVPMGPMGTKLDEIGGTQVTIFS